MEIMSRHDKIPLNLWFQDWMCPLAVGVEHLTSEGQQRTRGSQIKKTNQRATLFSVIGDIV